jgi:3-mercaptopyruvate sulfurtransferase SseA
MNQRLVYIVGGALAAALVAFAIWHAYQPKQSVAVTTPAPTTTPTTTHDETASVPRIEQDDLLAHLKAGGVTIVDVRDADAFLASHIPGALHIPLARVEGEVPYLPKAKPIVTYCT